jgi:protein-tyrosine phosphatase
VVCLGNICRSPIGQVVLADRVERAGLADRVEVVSAGTGGWHVGEPMDRRAATVLAASGYDGSAHRGRQFDDEWYDDCDLVLAMDADNHATLAGAAPEGSTGRLQLFRAFDPLATEDDRDVADPYYGGDEGFAVVLATVERTSDAIVAALERELGER